MAKHTTIVSVFMGACHRRARMPFRHYYRRLRLYGRFHTRPAIPIPTAARFCPSTPPAAIRANRTFCGLPPTRTFPAMPAGQFVGLPGINRTTVGITPSGRGTFLPFHTYTRTYRQPLAGGHAGRASPWLQHTAPPSTARAGGNNISTLSNSAFRPFYSCLTHSTQCTELVDYRRGVIA